MSKLTGILLCLTVAFFALYDVYATVQSGPEATITRVVYAAMQKWPIIGIAIGVVIGHVAWPHKGVHAQ